MIISAVSTVALMILILNFIGITKLRPDVCLYTKISGSPLSMIVGSLVSLTECWPSFFGGANIGLFV